MLTESLIKPDCSSSLAIWLEYIENLHKNTIELGLSRSIAVAQRLDILQPAPLVFTVAGTNGKGTTCRVLETILLAAGYRVGVYSSPHLIHYNERIRIQGKVLPEEQHCHAFSCINEARQTISLTYFEFSTLAALFLFKKHKLDVVILEVGLGGRLDATNIVDSDIAVITSIALDHIDWLGNNRDSIGREKAGIFRANRPAIIGEPEIPASIEEVAKTLVTPLVRVGKEWFYQQQGHVWQWYDEQQQWQNLPLPSIPLANAATALAALSQSELLISAQAIDEGLQCATLPGRFQVIKYNKATVILDVAHNPHAAMYLANKLRQRQKTGNWHAVVGILQDKDIAGIVEPLLPLIDRWYCGSLEGPRGTKAEKLATYLPLCGQFSSVTDAFNSANAEAMEQDIIIVFGSFHTVSEVLIHLEEQHG